MARGFPIPFGRLVRMSILLVMAASRVGLGQELIGDVTPSPTPAGVFVRESFGGRIQDVWRNGSVAIVGEGGLTILDLSDPARPRRLSRISSPGGRTTFDLEGSLAMIATRRIGVELYDVSDPANPRRVQFLERESVTLQAFMEEGRLWIGSGYKRLEFIDAYSLENPESPLVPVDYDEDVLHDEYGERRYDDLREAVRLIFPPAEDSEVPFNPPSEDPGFRASNRGVAFRTDTPAGPVETEYLAPTEVLDLETDGDRLVMSCGEAGLWVTKLGPDGLPALDSSITSIGARVTGSTVVGRLAYLAAETPGLWAVDLGDSDGLQAFQTGGDFGQVRFVRKVEGGRISIVAGIPEKAEEWMLLDLANPAAPSIVARVPLVETGWQSGASILLGDLLLLADGDVRLLDLSNPEHPIEIRRLECQGQTLVLDGNVAYGAAHSQSGLWTIDLSDPLESRSMDYSFGLPLLADHGRLVVGWRTSGSWGGDRGIWISGFCPDTDPEACDMKTFASTPVDAIAFGNRLLLANEGEGVIALSPWP